MSLFDRGNVEIGERCALLIAPGRKKVWQVLEMKKNGRQTITFANPPHLVGSSREKTFLHDLRQPKGDCF